MAGKDSKRSTTFPFRSLRLCRASFPTSSHEPHFFTTSLVSARPGHACFPSCPTKLTYTSLMALAIMEGAKSQTHAIYLAATHSSLVSNTAASRVHTASTATHVMIQHVGILLLLHVLDGSHVDQSGQPE